MDRVVLSPLADPRAAGDVVEVLNQWKAAEPVEGGDGQAILLSLNLQDVHASLAAVSEDVHEVSLGPVGHMTAAGTPNIPWQWQPQMMVAASTASRAGFRERNLFCRIASGATSTQPVMWYLDPGTLNVGIDILQLLLPINMQFEKMSKYTMSPSPFASAVILSQTSEVLSEQSG